MTGSVASRTAAGSAEGLAMEELVRLREVAQSPSAERVLDAIRGFLDMEVAFVSRVDEVEQTMVVVRGDGASFGIADGSKIPASDTFCHRILNGRLPSLIPDTSADDRAAAVPAGKAADVGAFVSVPLTFSDGSVHGTICAASHSAHPSLGYRELQFMHVFARIVADLLERGAAAEERRRVQLRETAAQTLIAAMQARDSYTAAHSRQVVEDAVAVARRLGLDEAGIEEIEHVALLHDIGKLSVPDAVLGKPGPLSEKEWELMRAHSARGEELVARTPALAHLAPAIRAEHERWDGGGYPDGLQGEQIPIASRITFVCDAYHAMTSDRPYRKARSPEWARAEIAEGAGGQFCPRVAEAFLAHLRDQGR